MNYISSIFSRHHEDLIRTFFRNVSEMLLERSGEIHITHKTTVYKRWKFNRSAKLCGLSLKKSLLFVPESFPGYVPCRGAGKNWITTFPLGKGSRTYIYGMDWRGQLRNIQSYWYFDELRECHVIAGMVWYFDASQNIDHRSQHMDLNLREPTDWIDSRLDLRSITRIIRGPLECKADNGSFIDPLP